ncbi:MAG: serine hydrolase domain-containing protein [Myxococcota bacterium]|nr:serine hydrolase domain-containing protein [Myxococcota bacterium]
MLANRGSVCALIFLVIAGVMPGRSLAQDATPAVAPKPVKHAKDGTLMTAGEIPIKVFAGWSSQVSTSFTSLTGPDGELKLWLGAVRGMGLEAAVKSAWTRAVPGFKREVYQRDTPPASDGWDAIEVITYKSTPAEGRIVQALARAMGPIVYVILIDGKLAAVQRRGAQIAQIMQSYSPKGLTIESFEGQTAKTWSATIATAFDAFVEQVMGKLKVPGAAIAIVQNDTVVFEKGYGLAEAGGQAVTPDTKFMIGSVSKSLTTLMAARLVHQGKLTWSTPMVDILPGFKLADKNLTKQVDLELSFCSCTGLPRQDLEFLFEYAGMDARQRLDELATMKPTTKLRETFQYSNGLVSAGGFGLGYTLYPKRPLVDGFREALQTLLIKPLKLDATTFDVAKVLAAPHALPHGRNLDGRYRKIPLSYEDAVRSVVPAGGLWSTVGDLAKVVRMELKGGRLPDGSVYIDESNLLHRRKAMVKMSKNSSYGLGLVVKAKDGLLSVGHPGNTIGFTALLKFYPQHQLGIVILANAQAANQFTGLIRRRMLELLFPTIDRDAVKGLAYVAQSEKKAIDTLMSKLTTPPPIQIGKRLLGRYSNEQLGTLTIEAKGSKIIANAGEWQTELGFYKDTGTELLMMTEPPLAGVPLNPKDDGRLVLDIGQQKYIFLREGQGKGNRP